MAMMRHQTHSQPPTAATCFIFWAWLIVYFAVFFLFHFGDLCCIDSNYLWAAICRLFSSDNSRNLIAHFLCELSGYQKKSAQPSELIANGPQSFCFGFTADQPKQWLGNCKKLWEYCICGSISVAVFSVVGEWFMCLATIDWGMPFLPFV